MKKYYIVNNIFDEARKLNKMHKTRESIDEQQRQIEGREIIVPLSAIEKFMNTKFPKYKINSLDILKLQIEKLISKEHEARELMKDAPSKIFNTGRISGMMDVIKLIETKEE